jgi:hypothetical protein
VNGAPEKADVLRLAERIANSLSYRIGSFASHRRERRDYQSYLVSGKPPFTAGYDVYKWSFIQNTLSDASLLERFRHGSSLPDGYGLHLDERAVEYPWVISRLSSGAGTLLDAGSALNYNALIELPILKEKTLHIVTLKPEANCFWKRGVSYAYADLRDLLVRDNFYDEIVCISTLEHVGLNNEIYTHEHIDNLNNADYKLAANELWRVLKPGGHLYLTVPFGQPCDVDWLQQFDSKMVQDLIETLRPNEVLVFYYKYGTNGWNIATEEACRDSQYTDPARWGVAQFVTTNQDSVETTTEEAPAAAGAVVCLDLVK